MTDYFQDPWLSIVLPLAIGIVGSWLASLIRNMGASVIKFGQSTTAKSIDEFLFQCAYHIAIKSESVFCFQIFCRLLIYLFFVTITSLILTISAIDVKNLDHQNIAFGAGFIALIFIGVYGFNFLKWANRFTIFVKFHHLSRLNDRQEAKALIEDQIKKTSHSITDDKLKRYVELLLSASVYELEVLKDKSQEDAPAGDAS